MIMEEKNRSGKYQISGDDTNTVLDERNKTHEDGLLKKIQSEQMQGMFDQVRRSNERDANREHYEDELLNQLMSDLLSKQSRDFHDKDHHDKDHAEMLMITSAVALTNQEKEAIVRKFIEKTHKQLRRITTVIDPTLITGVRLQSESFYYEVSGQKTLRELRKHLDKNWHY